MNYYIGIDLGTSAMKGVLTDGSGKIVRRASAEYNVSYPQAGWAEQDPSDWIAAMDTVLAQLSAGEEGKDIKGISFAGQMHGLVALNEAGEVIRPCILWNDGRTEKQTDYLNRTIGQKTLSDCVGNIAFAGFTAPKLLWMRKNEPNRFAEIDKIMLPKDYLAYYLSGVIATDYSDASGTLLLDVKKKRWSKKMTGICGISSRNLPTLHESFDVIGTLKAELAARYGMSEEVKIVIGAGDNAAAAIGNGIVGTGECNISLGTSGTILVCSDEFRIDSQNALHSFSHANGKWFLMGCILSAASCRKWWLENVLQSDDYDADEELISSCDSDQVIFLPYLSGERSPHNDVNARGVFVGLNATTDRAQMSRAVMEGVAFAIRDCLEVAKANGICPISADLCGGGAKSAVWQQIFADVLDLPVHIPESEQGPSFGAAILAMVGCGEYPDVETAVKHTVAVCKTRLPQKDRVLLYNRKYIWYKQLYPALKEYFEGTKYDETVF